MLLDNKDNVVVNMQDGFHGNSALSCPTSNDYSSNIVSSLLLGNGADVDSEYSALMPLAGLGAHTEAMDLLIERVGC